MYWSYKKHKMCHSEWRKSLQIMRKILHKAPHISNFKLTHLSKIGQYGPRITIAIIIIRRRTINE